MSVQQENLHNPKMSNPIAVLQDRDINLSMYEWANTMRETNPIYYDEQRDGWYFFLYEDVHRILHDPITFSSRRYPPQILISQSMLFSDPPRHTDLRAFVNKAFTPKMVADLEPRIQAVAAEFLDEVQDKDGIDIISDLSDPLPVTIIAEMLGVHPSERKMFRGWAQRFLQNANSTDPGEHKRLLEIQKAAQAALFDYLDKQIEGRRANPQDDLLSVLIHTTIDGVQLNHQELLAFCSMLLAAGSDTTTHLIAHTIRCFIDHPEVPEQLRANPALWQSALDEVLRFRPTLCLLNRVASTDTEYKGVQIKKGQGVTVWTVAANRDPRKFQDPDTFIIDRSPNQHLTFGSGAHFCLGAPLAKLEAITALKELYKRYQKFDYVPGFQLEPVPSILVNGVKNLPVLVTWA